MSVTKFKYKFSIENIGKNRFYFGIFLGFGYAIIFNYLLRIATMISNFEFYDEVPFFLSYKSFVFTQYMLNLISFSSVSFGFTFTIYIWLSGTTIENRKLKSKIRFAQNYSIFMLFVCLLFLIRLLTFFIQNPIYLENDLNNLSYLLPIFIFLYNWCLINKIYKSQKILLILIPILVIFGKILSLL